MTVLVFLFLFAPQSQESRAEELVQEIAESGRVVEIARAAEVRVEPTPKIAPGDPPLLAFRYFDGQARHRFGKLDLVMDDAGH